MSSSTIHSLLETYTRKSQEFDGLIEETDPFDEEQQWQLTLAKADMQGSLTALNTALTTRHDALKRVLDEIR